MVGWDDIKLVGHDPERRDKGVFNVDFRRAGRPSPEYQLENEVDLRSEKPRISKRLGGLVVWGHPVGCPSLCFVICRA